MKSNIRVRIAGSGRYVPEIEVPNSEFHGRSFHTKEGTLFTGDSETAVAEMERKTGIKSRRQCDPDKVTSDIGHLAALAALEDAGIEPDKLTGILFSHNLGNIRDDGFGRSETTPPLATLVKEKLYTPKPAVFAFDIGGGCAGWITAIDVALDKILAYYCEHPFDKEHPLRIVVIGADTLTRLCDKSDITSMTYSDGAGAVVLEAFESEKRTGIQRPVVKTYSHNTSNMIYLGHSNQRGLDQDGKLSLKVSGKTVMKTVLRYSKGIIMKAIETAGLNREDIKAYLFPQGNVPFNWALAEMLYEGRRVPRKKFPMTADWLPNTGPATLPILYDMASRGEFKKIKIKPGDNIVFYQVGAGGIDGAFVYTVPK